jgi:large subunit ribosomal protein L24
MYDEEGERVRISKRSGHIIPIPSSAAETADYKTKRNYVENKKKDTVGLD